MPAAEEIRTIALIVFVCSLAAAAIYDVAKRIIPNIIHLFIFVAWAGIVLAGHAAPLPSLAAGAITLLIGIFVFSRGWLGGGDAKLIAACALFIGPAQLPVFIFHMALIGGGLALLWRFEPQMRYALARTGMEMSLSRTGQIPYAVAIAGAGILAALRLHPV